MNEPRNETRSATEVLDEVLAESEGLPADRLDEILADGTPIVILPDDISRIAVGDTGPTVKARELETERAGTLAAASTAVNDAMDLAAQGDARASDAAPQVINLKSRRTSAAARTTAPPQTVPPPASPVVAGEGFDDLIQEVETTRRRQEKDLETRAPGRRRSSPRETRAPQRGRSARRETRVPERRPPARREARRGEEDWSLGELEEELDEEMRDELFPWAARMGIPWLGAAFALLVISLLGVLVIVGRSYYELPIPLRVFHHLHDVLRPSGSVGLTMGIGGLAIMLFSLLYLVRKQLVSWARFGSLQGWLGLHIFTGFLGPALVLFHAAFVPYSAIGVLAFASMLVVVFSGIVGRYVYVHCPKSLEGRELEFEDIRQRLRVYRKKLARLGIDPSLLRIDEPTTKSRRVPWLIQAIVGVVCGDRESKKEFARLSQALSERDDLRVQMSRVLLLARRLSRERQWVVRYGELRKLMGAWRFFHRWLAIIMLLAVLYHVGIAVLFGRLWIFGGKI